MPRKKELFPRAAFAEIGAAGLKSFSGRIDEEFLRRLKGIKGVTTYNEMRRNDAIVGSMLFAVEQLIQNAALNIVPGEDTNEGLKAADLIKTALDDTSQPWIDVLSSILTFLPFGWSYHNVVLKKREGFNRDPRRNSKYNDGLIGWRKISLRGQDSLDRWELGENGSILGMWQRPPPTFQEFFVPIANSILFRTKPEKNNPEGTSVLRNSVRPYYFKKHLEEVEGIGVERELTGLPVMTPPEGVDIWNTKDDEARNALNQAETIVRSIRRDEHEGIVKPFGWELELLASAGQRTYDTSEIIGRWDQRIAVTLLADMLLIGHEKVGSFALVTSKTKLFSVAMEGYAKQIASIFNRFAIPRLLLVNGMSVEKPPQMEFGPIETPSLKELGEYVAKLSGAGFVLDEDLDKYLRQVANFPEPLGPPAEVVDVFDPNAEEKVVEGKEGTTTQTSVQSKPIKAVRETNKPQPKETGTKPKKLVKKWILVQE